MRATCVLCDLNKGKWGFSLMPMVGSKVLTSGGTLYYKVEKGDVVCVACAYAYDIAIDQCLAPLGDRRMTATEVDDLFKLMDTTPEKEIDYRKRLVELGLVEDSRTIAASNERKKAWLQRRLQPSFLDRSDELRERFRNGEIPLKAKYKGLCINCERIVEIGEQIFFKTNVGIWHVDCKFAIGGQPVVKEAIVDDPVMPQVGRKFRILR